jgi:hypothetical protein
VTDPNTLRMFLRICERFAQEFNRTPEGIAQQKLFNTGLVSDDFAIEIPSLDPDLSDYNDYNKAEDW